MNEPWYGLSEGEDNRVPYWLQTSKHDLRGVDEYDLVDGKRIQNWDAHASLSSNDAERDGDPDDFLAVHLGFPVLSARLRNALAGAQVALNDLQFLPVRVFKSTGEEVKGFAIANVISRVMALDYERSGLVTFHKSDLDRLTGKPRVTGIGVAALLAEPLRGHDVVRLLEFFPKVVVSQRFVDVVRKGKFTGATFKRLKTSWFGAAGSSVP